MTRVARLALVVAGTLGCLDDWRYHPPDASRDVVDAADAAARDAPTDTADAPTDTPLDAPADVALDVAPDALRDASLDVAPAAPRLLAPWSLARVSAPRPTLRWIPSAPDTRVELCADRACTRVDATFDVSTDRVRPTAALSPGVHYWRASSRVGGRTVATSATWEFFVGHGAATSDAPVGTVADFNGDGYADVVVGATYALSLRGRVFVYQGGPTGVEGSPTTTLAAPDGATAAGSEGQFGGALACAGDVNGDGYADLVAGARTADGLRGRAYVFLGSPAGLVADAPQRLLGLDGAESSFGGAVAGLGDVDGDGYAEVAVGAALATPTRVHVYAGSAAGTVTTAAYTLTTDDTGSPIGSSIAGGDTNADGYADLIVGNHDATGGDPWAWVVPGGATGLQTARRITLANDLSGGSTRVTVSLAGDVDGDGVVDVLLGAPEVDRGVGRMFVHHGGAARVEAVARTRVTGDSDARGSFATALSSAGDVNGDGYDDVVVGASGVRTQTGRAWIYPGASTGVASKPLVTLDAGTSMRLFGASVAGVGDIDRDGFDDVAVGAPGSRLPSGTADAALVYRGRAGAWDAPGAQSLTGAVGREDDFGGAVAWRGVTSPLVTGGAGRAGRARGRGTPSRRWW